MQYITYIVLFSFYDKTFFCQFHVKIYISLYRISADMASRTLRKKAMRPGKNMVDYSQKLLFYLLFKGGSIMLLDREYKIPSKVNNKINLKVVPGHFATTHSHINFYMDMTTLKMRHSEAMEVAKTIASDYQYSRPVDTIICMDGCEMIGSCLAEELTKNGIMSLNRHNTLYVITPEFDSNGQMIFRDNLQPMVRGKNILLLLASATTGRTIARSLECIRYYGGIIQGISAIFSAAEEIYGEPVHHIFGEADLPDYQTFSPEECPHCRNKEKIDAIVNGFGYSEL